MPGDRRYVFDVNVLVSALLVSNSVPRQAFDKASAQGRLLVSSPVLDELDDVLRRDKLRKYITDEERLHFLGSLLHDSILKEPEERIEASRDPDDDKYLELEVAGDAKGIVTGDKDLLDLKSIRGIPILTPRQFLDGDI